MTWTGWPVANPDATVSDLIFKETKRFLEEGPSIEECDFSPFDGITVPIAQFSTIANIEMPGAEDYVNHIVPSRAQISATPLSPSYGTTYQDIAAIALSDISTALYGDYVLPATLPGHNVGAPDLGYPIAGFQDVKRYAGLDDNLPVPEIVVGSTPAVLEVPTISYDLTDFDPFDVPIPTLPTLPDVELLGNPEKFLYEPSPELMAALDKALAKEGVLSTEAQRIMVDRPKRELDKKFYDEQRAAFIKAAAAGHVNTNGSLVHELSEIAYEASFDDRKIYEAMRDETYEAAMEHLTEAVKSALSIEALNGAAHLSYAEKLVETLKYNVAMQIEYANMLVEMFNVQLKAVRTLITAYEQYVAASVSDYKTYTAVIDAQNAILDTNSAKVSVYAAQAGTIESQADVYSTQVKYATHPLDEYTIYVSGILKNIDIARTNIEAFTQATRAYSQAIDVDTAMINGYADQVRATGSATGVYEANYGAYAEGQSASRASNEARRNWYSSSMQALGGEISAFQEAARGQRSYIQALTAWSRANASLHGQHAAGVSAKSGYTKAFNRHLVSLQESQSNIDLSAADAEARMDGLTAQAQAVQYGIDIGLEASKATSAAGCAQAAYSVRSISAGMRANVGMSDTSTRSGTTRETVSSSRSFGYTKTASTSA